MTLYYVTLVFAMICWLVLLLIGAPVTSCIIPAGISLFLFSMWNKVQQREIEKAVFNNPMVMKGITQVIEAC